MPTEHSNTQYRVHSDGRVTGEYTIWHEEYHDFQSARDWSEDVSFNAGQVKADVVPFLDGVDLKRLLDNPSEPLACHDVQERREAEQRKFISDTLYEIWGIRRELDRFKRRSDSAKKAAQTRKQNAALKAQAIERKKTLKLRTHAQ